MRADGKPMMVLLSTFRRILSKSTSATFVWAVVALARVVGCGQAPATPSQEALKPAHVERPLSEAEIGQVHLTAEAEKRLGIRLSAAEELMVARQWLTGGEVMVPSGRILIVSAPVAGTVTVPSGTSLPNPGHSVKVGESLLEIQPLLSPERNVPSAAERVQMANARATLLTAQSVAEGELARLGAEVETAQIALKRAEKLFKDRAGSARSVDDARGQLKIAEASLSAAAERRDRLRQLSNQLDQGPHATASVMPILAPQDGLIRNLSVNVGQTVTAGSTLFEVVDLSVVWIRVPVYVGISQDLDPDAPATVDLLRSLDGATPSSDGVILTARPIAAPPSADPLSMSVDHYYEMENSRRQFTPGQRVGVQLPLRGKSKRITVPRSSLLYDMHGFTWVYAQVAERAYERRRIEVDSTFREMIVVARGLAPGESVVTEGAAELFGTEFGVGK